MEGALVCDPVRPDPTQLDELELRMISTPGGPSTTAPDLPAYYAERWL
jgi:hypothetical protein